MANRTRSSLANVARGLVAGDDVTDRLRTARGKIGTGIAWITVQKWVDAGFLERDDAAGPKAVRYRLTQAGVDAALEAKARAAKTVAAKVQRTKRAKRRAAVMAASKPVAAPKPPRPVPAPVPRPSVQAYRPRVGEPAGQQCMRCGASMVVAAVDPHGAVRARCDSSTCNGASTEVR